MSFGRKDWAGVVAHAFVPEFRQVELYEFRTNLVNLVTFYVA